MCDWVDGCLIQIHGLLSFLADGYGFFDPSRKSIWLSVDHRRLISVDLVILLHGR